MMRIMNTFYKVLPYEAPACWAWDCTTEGVLAQSLEDWEVTPIDGDDII